MEFIAQDITIGYGERVIQRNISFCFSSGTVVALLGVNGCGKSTLLKTLMGQIAPLRGKIFIENIDLAQLTPMARAKHISLVSTSLPTIQYATVQDIIRLGRYPHTSLLGTLKEYDKLVIRKTIEQMRLEDFCSKNFNDLSDGERQRVLIAKTLVQQTPVILLDEPTAHLDLPNRIRIFEMLRKIAKEQQKIVLISTHELDLALHFSDTILLLTPLVEGGEWFLESPQTLRDRHIFEKVFKMNIFDKSYANKN